MNRNYVAGRRLEYEVRTMFERAGWVVTRAASSKGPFDLVAVKLTAANRKAAHYTVIESANGAVALVQTKRRKR